MAVVHLSPELPRLTVRGHKREPSEPIDLLSASPSVVAADGDDSPGLLQRSYSGRPRSSSSSSSNTSSQANNSKQRKSLRLSRSRPVSWMNKTKQGGDGGTGHNRRGSASDADNATTQQIDSAFTKIKEQLAKLSEEDEVLKERVDKLNEEVNILNTSTALRYLHTRRESDHQASVTHWKSASFSVGGCHSRMPSSPATVPILLVSSSSQDSLDRLDELETVHNNQNVLHCTGINGIAENPGEIDIDSTFENAGSPTKSTVLHNLSPLPIS